MTEDGRTICRHHTTQALQEAIAWTQHYHNHHAQHPTIQSRTQRLLYHLQKCHNHAQHLGLGDRPQHDATEDYDA